MGLYDRDGLHWFSHIPEHQWAAPDLSASGEWAHVSMANTAIGTRYTDNTASVGFVGPYSVLGTQISQRTQLLAGGPLSPTRAYQAIVRWIERLEGAATSRHVGTMAELFENPVEGRPS